MKFKWSQVGLMKLRACALALAAFGSAPTEMAAQTYKLSPVFSGNGTITSSDKQIDCTNTNGVVSGTCTATYSASAKTEVTLSASAAANWMFQNWSNGCSSVSADGCVLTMTQAYSPQATFGQNRLALPTTGVYLGILAWPGVYPAPANMDCTMNNGSLSKDECAIEVREGSPPSASNPQGMGIGRRFALHLHSTPWNGFTASGSNCDFGNQADLCDDLQHGRVPVINWECDDNSTLPTGYSSTDEVIGNGAPDEPDYCDPDDVGHAAFCAEEQVIAAAAKALKLYPGPVMLRWNWEFNIVKKTNNEYCRGIANEVVDGKKVTQTDIQQNFVNAWQNIWTIFQNAEVTNVIFVWSPMNYTPGKNDDPQPYYPGSGYVDWISLDTFQRSTSEDFADNFNGPPGSTGYFYDVYSTYNKPLMVGATGSLNYGQNNVEVEAPYLATGSGSLLSDLQNKMYPNLKAYEYFDSTNANTSNPTPYSFVLDPPLVPPSDATTGYECGTGANNLSVCQGVTAMATLGASPQFSALPQTCSVTLSPSGTVTVPSSGVVKIEVATTGPTTQAAANCPWSIGPLPSWIEVQSVQSQGQTVGPAGQGAVTLLVVPPGPGLQWPVEIGGAVVTIKVP